MEITIRATADVNQDYVEADKMDMTIRAISYRLGNTPHSWERLERGRGYKVLA